MKLSWKSIPYRSARTLGTLILFFLFSGASSFNSADPLAVLIFLAGFTVVYGVLLAWEYLVWKNFSYSFEEGKVKIRKGVIRKSDREIPLKRIQNVDVSRNIVHRVLGISKVGLETAGGNKTEASFRYVELHQAQKIREDVKQGSPERIDKQDEDSDRTLEYSISEKNLMILSAVSVDQRTVFGVLTGLGVFLAGSSSFIQSTGTAPPTSVLGVVAFIGLSGIFGFNFATNLEKYYGFKLWRKQNSLKYERGLLNRKEGTIPMEKIQGLTVDENLLKRILGYSTLKISTAGYSGEKAVKQGSESAIPLDTRANIIGFAQSLQDLKKPELQPVSSKARIRYTTRYLVIFTSITALAYVFQAPQVIFYVLGALYLISPVAGHLKWKNKGYSLGSNHFYARNGFWNRKTMITPYYRVQNIIESQTIFQRRWMISSLTIDIAGTGFVSDNPEIHDLDTERTNEVKQGIYTKFRKSLD